MPLLGRLGYKARVRVDVGVSLACVLIVSWGLVPAMIPIGLAAPGMFPFERGCSLNATCRRVVYQKTQGCLRICMYTKYASMSIRTVREQAPEVVGVHDAPRECSKNRHPQSQSAFTTRAPWPSLVSSSPGAPSSQRTRLYLNQPHALSRRAVHKTCVHATSYIYEGTTNHCRGTQSMIILSPFPPPRSP